MKTKPILCPQRLRHVPPQFSWIDQRLVRDRHIHGRSSDALALYLFLCTVADAQGASYYADASTAKLLGFSSAQLRAARDELVAAGLIAWRAPFYQVLSLEPGTPTAFPAAAAAATATATATAATAATAASASAPATSAPVVRPLEIPALRTTGETRSIGDILRAMMKEPQEGQAP